jgi:hypothetical protein
MFEAVTKKLGRAEYFLNNLEDMASVRGGIPSLSPDDLNALRANLDAFFFELVSAKDFFLQEVNDRYAHLPKKKATHIDQLKPCLVGHADALAVVESIGEKMSQRDTWLWKINKYRNAATHWELFSLNYIFCTGEQETRQVYLNRDPENPDQGHADIEVMPYCQQSLNEMKAFLDELYSQLHITS